MTDVTEEVQEPTQAPGPADLLGSPTPPVGEGPKDLDEALNTFLDEDQKQRIAVAVEAAPKFKPVKALSASGKMEFTAAVAGMDDIQAQLRNAEFSEALLAAASSAIVSMCESALQLMAVSRPKYDAWSAGIDMDLIFPVMLKVFNQQSELLGK